MFKTHIENLQVVVYTDVFCNKCGRSCSDPESSEPLFVELKVRWGYGSTTKDGDTHQSHLCEECYDQVVASFKYPPRAAEEAPLVDPISEWDLHFRKCNFRSLTGQKD